MRVIAELPATENDTLNLFFCLQFGRVTYVAKSARKEATRLLEKK